VSAPRLAGAGADVPAAFDDVAGTYDLMVALSPGYHRQLRDSADVLVASVREQVRPGERAVRVADLGCGSGASTRALEEALAAAGYDYQIIAVDGSARMLDRARVKPWRGGVTFRQADAETLAAEALSPGTDGFDGVLAAYLFRNVAARDHLLGQVRAMLRPGAALVVHDYSVRDDALAKVSWGLVSWGVIIPLGLLTAPRSGIYRYLWRSVLDFDGATGFRDRMARCGFERVRSRTFGGWQRGMLHTFVGHAPGVGTQAP